MSCDPIKQKTKDEMMAELQKYNRERKELEECVACKFGLKCNRHVPPAAIGD